MIEIKATLAEQISEAEANLARTKTTLTQQISQAEASFQAIAEVRGVDVSVAQAELEVAEAAVNRAQADLELAYVKSPIEGQILEINTWPGEMVNKTEGIVEVGNTENMYVVAEVYETDIGRISIGQTATITSGGIIPKLTGTVDDLGWQIGTKDVLDTDPVADVDAVVVYQILYTNVSEHLKEYATLKAIGYSHRYLLNLVFQQALIIGSLGYIPGFAIAILMYKFAQEATLLPIAMTGQRAINILFATIIMCLIAGVSAVRKMKSANPADIF